MAARTIDLAANRLTLTQAETLLCIQAGRTMFTRREAKSVEKLVYCDLVTAKFDISSPDPIRGRVHEIWRECAITAKGTEVCAALRTRFLPLMEPAQ